MKTTDQIIDPQIERIISETLMQRSSPEELQLLQQWLQERPEHQTYFTQCTELFFAASVVSQPQSFDSSAAFLAFCARKEQQISPASPKKSANKTFRRIWTAAAACVVAACVSVAFYGLGQRGVEGQFRPIVIETPIGGNLKLTLPDGSQLFLNANSRVSYSQGFGVLDRNIELQGEGYFEAVHQAGLPLRVKTKEMTIEVLGTKFNVTNYENQPKAYVELVEGSVLLSNAFEQELCRLQANEQAVFDKSTGEATVERKSLQAEKFRDQGELVFRNESLERIAIRLEQIYGVQIELDDARLASLRFHGSFVQSQTSMVQILDVLVCTGRVRYTRDGNNIRIFAVANK